MLKFTTKVMIVDDHPIIRCGIARLIDREIDMEVCGEFDGTENIPAIINSRKPDVLIMDISLKNTDGITITRKVRKIHKSLPILILSMHDNRVYISKAIKAGANGYVVKDQSAEDLVKAIRKIRQGGIFLSCSHSEELLCTTAVHQPSDKSIPIEWLSDRERQIFAFIGRGYSTKEIAEQLEINRKTVETYRIRIKDKLNLEKPHMLSLAAIEWATKEGLTASSVM